jgi:site-specific DNA-methyltransferase (adenine-specific)
MARHGTKAYPPGRYGLPLEEAFVLSKGEPTDVHLLRDRVNKHGGEGRAVRFRLPDGSVKKQERYVISPTGARSSVWRYAVGRHVAEEPWVRRAAHGALMPEKMAEDLILSYSKADALIFDPFCGLATTCKMALLNHRRYLGMEVSAEYHRLAVKRMSQAHARYLDRLNALLVGA